MISPGPRMANTFAKSRSIKKNGPLSLVLLLVFLVPGPAFAQTLNAERELARAMPRRTLFDLPKSYKDSTFQFFPIPIFQTDPAEGQRYGVMPTFLWYDKKDQLTTIVVTALTYNPQVVKWGGYLGAYFYPSSKESLQLFIREGQNFEKDYYLYYNNESYLNNKLDLEGEFEYIQNPFERFFGFGPTTRKSNETNFVSHVWVGEGRAAYEFWPHINIQLDEKWVRLRIEPRALNSLSDTSAIFGNNPEVRDFNQWIHRFSFFRDTRDSNDMPMTGHYVEPYALISYHTFDGETFYTGYGLLAKNYLTLQRRFTTVASFKVNQVFGDLVPFYLQPSLGGDSDLRAFVDNRFTGRGNILLDLEERILIKRWTILNAKFNFSLDPFFSVGQVFDNWGQVQFHNLQPVGGIGFRAKVPPSVVGRVDFGFGTEGMAIYMTLRYPF